MASATETADQTTSRLGGISRRDLMPYLFLLPFFLIYGVFYFWPIVWAPWMSFQSFSFAGTEFVGLDNYAALPQGQFVTTLFNTLMIALIVIPAQVIVGLVIAVLLNSSLVRFRKLIRSGYIVPTVMSTTVLAIIFDTFLSQNGILNQLFMFVAGTTVYWLTDPMPAKISVALVVIWRQMGITVLIYLAGLQGIPQHLYRAAKVDGANRYQQFRHITVPQLRPISVLVVILTTSQTLRLFDVPYVLTDGGPGNASKTIVMLLFEAAFSSLNLGYAAAIGTVLSVMLAAVLIVQYRVGSEN
jgi:ABC-type sugar transport system permease subunit